MPKSQIKNQPKQQISQIEIKKLKTLKNVLPNILLTISSSESGKKYKTKKMNDYIYFTPIPKGVKRNFFPSKPKKKKNCGDGCEEELIVKGRNLIYIFESM
jgi:hypothetical protein